MTIYETLINEVKNGKNYSIDFIHKDLRINGKYLVKNGEYEGQYGFLSCKAKEKTEELYEKFYRSKPSEWGDRHLSLFKSLPLEKLTEAEKVSGEERLVALAALEGYVLGLILSNTPFSAFVGDSNAYVWQSTNNKELVLFRELFE